MKYKLTIILFVLIVFFSTANCQILQPVHWSYGAKKISKTEAIIFIKAQIDDGWHIYSVNQAEGGPVKTTISFEAPPGYELIGGIYEPTPIVKYEKVFSMDVHYFEKAVIFHQKVMLTSKDAVVSGKVSFMACNHQKCLPPDEVEFHIPIK